MESGSQILEQTQRPRKQREVKDQGDSEFRPRAEPRGRSGSGHRGWPWGRSPNNLPSSYGFPSPPPLGETSLYSPTDNKMGKWEDTMWSAPSTSHSSSGGMDGRTDVLLKRSQPQLLAHGGLGGQARERRQKTSPSLTISSPAN